MRATSNSRPFSAADLASPGARSAGRNSSGPGEVAMPGTILSIHRGGQSFLMAHIPALRTLNWPCRRCVLHSSHDREHQHHALWEGRVRMKTEDLRRLQDADRAFHLHPFTNHAEMHAQGTHVIESAEGCYLTDATGRRLLDGLAGLWCVNVGYSRVEILQA